MKLINLHIFCLFLLFQSCSKNQKIKQEEPIYITSKYLKKVNKTSFGKTYLMETSQDFLSEAVKNEAEDFFKQNCDICSIPDSIDYYSFTIMEKTECTTEYLYRERRDGDTCWENQETGEFSYFTPLSRLYKRDSINKNKWIYYYKNEQIKDSIIFCKDGKPIF